MGSHAASLLYPQINIEVGDLVVRDPKDESSIFAFKYNTGSYPHHECVYNGTQFVSLWDAVVYVETFLVVDKRYINAANAEFFYKCLALGSGYVYWIADASFAEHRPQMTIHSLSAEG